MVWLLLVLFSFWPTLIDFLNEALQKQWNSLCTVAPGGSQWGYSIVNFVLLYVLGAYIERGLFCAGKWKSGTVFSLWLACVFVLVIWARINDKTGYLSERSGWEYCNPVVIFSGMLIIELFRRWDIGCKKWINAIASAAFSVFLFHGIIIQYLRIESFVNRNLFVMLAHIACSVVLIYGASFVAHVIYHAVMNPIWKVIEKKIPLPDIDPEVKAVE